MKQLSHNWTYLANLPEPFPEKDKRDYLLKLFEKAYNEGYEQCQEDIREVLNVPSWKALDENE